jgi:hypothetical protein
MVPMTRSPTSTTLTAWLALTFGLAGANAWPVLGMPLSGKAPKRLMRCWGNSSRMSDLGEIHRMPAYKSGLRG